MNRKLPAMALSTLAGATLIVATAPPVTARADSSVTHNLHYSEKSVRVYAENDCQGKSVSLSPGENAPWKVASLYQKPKRVILWNWSWPTRTKKKGKCFNVPPLPALALVVNYKKA